MARRVFFSFHYQDVVDFRANVVRNHWLLKKDRSDAGFFDASIWESARRTGVDAVKRVIDGGLENTSATCVLIGSLTYSRRWVRYEIIKSIFRGNKVLGVHINGIPDKLRTTKVLGADPFDYLAFTYSGDGKALRVSEYENGVWTQYKDMDGWNLKNDAPLDRRGRWLKLSQMRLMYPIFDWVGNDGYKNFSTWAE
jgi:antiphage defense system Thoeris ThsB-like protein